MERLTIDVSASLKQLVQDHVAEVGLPGVGEYVRRLIVADLRREARERLDAILLEGLESGESIELTPEFWDDLDRRLVERHEALGGLP